ncbi:carbon catabolite repressor protein 4 homolog 4 isoform X1, partial [Tanacetum coccineum]
MKNMSNKAKDTVTVMPAVTTVYPKFVAVEQKEITSVSKSDGFKFRVVSYNILAQELDEYDNFYKEKVAQNDYSSIYNKRSGKKLTDAGSSPTQQLVIEEKIDYNDLAELILDESARAELKVKALDTHSKGQGNNSKDRGDPNDPYVRLKRDCVEQGFFKDPEWADVKLAQAKYLLSRVAQFKKMVSEKFECTPSVLIAGDFNSVPGDK